MSAPTGWVCRQCQLQLKSISIRPVLQRPSRRSFVSLQDVPKNLADELEVPAKKSVRKQTKAAGKHIINPQSASDVFLEKLFKSTGREAPTAPLHLQYSRRTLSFSTPDEKPHKRNHAPTSKSNANHTRHLLGPGSRGKDVARLRRARQKLALKSPTRSADLEGHKFEDGSAASNESQSGLTSSDINLEEGSNALKKEENAEIDGIPTGEHTENVKKLRAETPAIRRIRGAIKRNDMRMVKDIFLMYQREVRDGKFDAEEHLITSTYTSMLVAFSEAKLYPLTADVWAAIKERGTPTLKQWSHMLELARKQGDVPSLQAIWSAMQAENVLPDNISWGIYISGLKREGYNTMMNALAQLERQWTFVAYKGKETVENMLTSDMLRYMPSIIPYNAALEKVVFARNDRLLTDILDRAGRMGVKPTIETYNVLLKRSLRVQDTEFQVQSVLKMMKKAEIEPDTITLTTLIVGTIRNIGGEADPAIVAAKVKELFDDLTSWNVTPAPHIYTAAFRVLLKSEPPMVDAACSVLSHMSERGVEPSAHIYTLLLRHYFQEERKTLIDDLFRRAKQREIKVDSFFFDRLIEGFAKSGETDRMLDCLRQLPYVGMPPSWSALTKAVLALGKSNDWEPCKEIVQDLESNRGIGSLGIKAAPKEERQFWDVVDGLRREGVI